MAQKHARPGEVVDLSSSGAGALPEKTTAIVKSERFEAIHLIVRSGVEIPPHQVSGPITLQCLYGRVILGLQDGEVELSGGQWIFLDGGAMHSVKGIEDATLLLTIIFV